MQQGLKFIRVYKSVVTAPSNMELCACEINHFSWFWCTWVNLCDDIFWTLPSTDTKLVPLDTAKIKVYKNVLKHCDIPITIGAVNPWSKPCFMVLYALVKFCVTISPEPYNLWTWNLYRRIQQGLEFLRMCWSVVTFTLDLEVRAQEINHLLVILCDHISWTPYTTHGHGTCSVGYSKSYRIVTCL